MKQVLFVEVIKSYEENDPTGYKHLWYRVIVGFQQRVVNCDSSKLPMSTLDIPSYVFLDKVRLARYINATWPGFKVRVHGIHVSKHASTTWWFSHSSDLLTESEHKGIARLLRQCWYNKGMMDIIRDDIALYAAPTCPLATKD